MTAWAAGHRSTRWHAKWLKTTRAIPWRAPIASLNYLLTSHVWRQDHNGFSHQDPGFIAHMVNKKAEIVRVHLPPDTNTLLSIADHCLRSRHHVNVIVAGQQPTLNYLTIDEAVAHCARGLGIWPWAGTDDDAPDVVLACAGDVPTLETLAAADLLRTHLPELKVRVVNVVDLMRLQSESASLAAVVDGRSVDTTMGFTPLDGLVMATRSGTVDPGPVLWLEEHEHLTPHEIATALEHRSGLTALAGTGDMREVGRGGSW